MKQGHHLADAQSTTLMFADSGRYRTFDMMYLQVAVGEKMTKIGGNTHTIEGSIL